MTRTVHIVEKSWMVIFLATSAFFANCLFLHGFFPMNKVCDNGTTQNDLPSTLHNISVRHDVLLNRSVGRLVFIVIDAFRHDFIEKHMPYTMNLVHTRKGSLLTVRCHPPTATMPRVKALMTGTVPNYIDVILNLGTMHAVEDSLIHQAVARGMGVVFYGDETWLQLFPKHFMRSEGTTSFFVSDYTEVDKNVTRHIPAEMSAQDWDILVLHYLGLDHIGHLSGPSSSLVPPKLKEMDDVVQTVHKGLQDWDSKHPEKQSLLVVVGDHGMHDSGSHGGATLGEVLVSLVLIGQGTTKMSIPDIEVSQIDVTATLAILLGLPIPKCSLGSLIPQALSRLAPKQYLYALYYSAYHVAKKFVTEIADGSSQAPYEKFVDAQHLHATWLWSGEVNMELHKKVEALYMEATYAMSRSLIDRLVEFDFLAMSVACFLLMQVLILSCICPTLSLSKFWVGQSRIALALTGAVLLAVGIFVCRLTAFRGFLCSCSYQFLPITVITIVVLSINTWFIFGLIPLTRISQLQSSRKVNVVSLFLRFGCILHTVSLGASSLIEEEHQTWYFLWVTVGLLILFSVARERTTRSLWLVTKVLVLLVCHRVLRKLNQTGDKWASLPDVADWLRESHNGMFLTFTAVAGLIGTWISMYWLARIKCIVDGLLYGGSLFCVLLYRAGIGEIVLPFSYSSRSAIEVSLFWLLLCVTLIRSLHRARHSVSMNELFTCCASHWLLISSRLMRSHSIILVPSLAFMSAVIHSLHFGVSDCTLAHVWIGAVGFFYQGNSNNLATIDVAAGYVGAQDHQLWIVGILVAVHTLAAPVGAVFLLWAGLTEPNALHRKERCSLSPCHAEVEVADTLQLRKSECMLFKELNALSTCLNTLLVQRLVPLSVYCIIVWLQSHHLFVWTVFAPKLLYESVLSVAILTLILVGCTLILNYSKLCAEKRHS